ncbi:MAG TPA: hypothetical protein VIC06_06860 [Solirubrobacteraceae bacterium]|jgi:hypothetical protein
MNIIPRLGRSLESAAHGRLRPFAISTREKFEDLLGLGMTSAEIALASDSSLRAVEDRRRKLKDPAYMQTRSTKLDLGIDALYSLALMLETRKIEPANIRAWLLGRSAYLEEQRPAILLSAGEFDLVREAAIAYATSETPGEFLDKRGPIPRVAEPTGV